jgi:hypothetical protein
MILPAWRTHEHADTEGLICCKHVGKAAFGKPRGLCAAENGTTGRLLFSDVLDKPIVKGRYLTVFVLLSVLMLNSVSGMDGLSLMLK